MAESPEKAETQEFKTGLEKACLFIITWGVYAAIFVPLIIMTQFFFPFVSPKSTIFRILVEIIFAAYLVLFIHKPSYRPKINLLTIYITVFLAVFILASLFGVNFNRSFWSTYERMTGLWSMLHLYAFFVVLVSCFKKRKDWEKILGFSILSGVLLSLYILRGNQISTRGGGTIGNTSFMAAYLLFDVFFAIILLLSNFLRKSGWPLFWQIYSAISLLIIMPVFFASTARGAITFFEIGILLMALGFLLFSGRKNLRRAGLAIILVSIISGTIVLISPPDFVKDKINSLLLEMKPRFTMWRIGFESWKERPLLGWGPENFNVAFGKHFNPCLFTSECGSEIWFDRAHSIVFDTLATTGLIGLLSYLAMFATAIFGFLRMLPKIADKRNLFMPLGMSALLIAYFFQNFLVFDMINTYLMLFLSLAFACFLGEQGRTQEISPEVYGEKVEQRNKKINSFLVSLIVVATAVAVWSGNIQPLLAGEYIVKMAASQSIPLTAEYFQKALNTSMNKYEAREHFAQKLSKSASYPASEGENLFKALSLAEKEMEKSVLENPDDFRPNLFLGKLYNVSYQITKDKEKLALARKYGERSLELSPANQQAYWYLGEVMLAVGKPDEAISLFEKAVDLEPSYVKARWYLAIAYKYTGNFQLAKEGILAVKEMGYNWDSDFYEINQAIDVFQALRDDETLLSLYQKALQLRPDDVKMWSGLIATYANLGEFDKAREAARQVKEMRPEAAAGIDEFVKSFPR